MNIGLLGKTLRDSRLLLIIVVCSVVLFEILFVLSMSQISTEVLQIWRSVQFVGTLIRGLVGIDVSQDVSANALLSLGLVAPFFLMVTSAYIVNECGRVLAGECDTGTADLLLTLPIARRTVYVTVSLSILFGAVLMCVAGWGGIALGAVLFKTAEPVRLDLFGIVACNLFALYIALIGGGLLVSSVVSRRVTAAAWVIAALLLSFLINFIGSFLEPVRQIAWLGFLFYYQPVDVVREEVWPIRDLVVLTVVGVLFWLAGLWRFARRDIPAA